MLPIDVTGMEGAGATAMRIEEVKAQANMIVSQVMESPDIEARIQQSIEKAVVWEGRV